MEKKYKKYIEILESELVPAMGCTEPISIALAAAKAKDILGCMPTSAHLVVSGNIIKNVKSVTVPHTGGMRGLKSALVAGLVIGNPNGELETLSIASDDDIMLINKIKDELQIEVEASNDQYVFDIGVTLTNGIDNAYVRIVDNHTNIVSIKKNGEVLFEKIEALRKKPIDKSILNVEDIIKFADMVNIDDVKHILKRQIEYNMAIAEEGLKNSYGANIGKVILKNNPNDIKNKAKAYAAAGSDARMNGCELPVIINSGSGNQGITASVPLVIYAQELNISEERLYRSLCISNLITIHLKTGIGTLSAYCGVVSAGAGVACGIAYLLGNGYEEIAHTLVNSLAIDSGIICDGAKASCAAKIATSVETGILGLEMYFAGNQFYDGEGIVKHGVENTIKSVSRLAKYGMRETDKEIIRIMIEE